MIFLPLPLSLSFIANTYLFMVQARGIMLRENVKTIGHMIRLYTNKNTTLNGTGKAASCLSWPCFCPTAVYPQTGTVPPKQGPGPQAPVWPPGYSLCHLRVSPLKSFRCSSRDGDAFYSGVYKAPRPASLWWGFCAKRPKCILASPEFNKTEKQLVPSQFSCI